MRAELTRFLGDHAQVMQVTITRVRGSSPRERGAWMLVADTGVLGTIGGGQLEYMALDKARTMLARGLASAEMDVPLGPEIGQCCGGRVLLALNLLDAAGRDALLAKAEAQDLALPLVQIHGAGHVGRALATALAHLPVRAVLIDSRAEELALCDAPVETRLTPLPEAEVRAAPAGSAFVILTHDHALDFLLSAEALARGDAAYVGLIGSATKRARFDRFCRSEGGDPSALICPIGAGGSADKRPAVIAALVAAEIITALTNDVKTKTSPARGNKPRTAAM